MYLNEKNGERERERDRVCVLMENENIEIYMPFAVQTFV